MAARADFSEIVYASKNASVVAVENKELLLVERAQRQRCAGIPILKIDLDFVHVKLDIFPMLIENKADQHFVKVD
jgi:hypothetical protein